MVVTPFIILHGAPGMEITLLEYLTRVLLHLFVFGGVAGLVLRGPGVVEAIRRFDRAHR